MTAARKIDDGRKVSDAQWTPAVVPPEPTCSTEPIENSARADALLLLYADALDDLERVRIATENRVRSLVQVKGMEGSPEQARLEGLCDGLKAMEHGAELELKRALRSHPLGPWVKRTVGVGEKQGARLLAAIGDPGERRTVSQLWAYCGYHVLNPSHDAPPAQYASAGVHPLHPDQSQHDSLSLLVGVDPSSDTAHGRTAAHTDAGGVAPRRRKGVKANWNSTAKMRAYLIAESCIKQRHSPYRAKYDTRRAHTATTHPEWTDGHSHADALRVVAKEVLKDLWVEARRIRGAS